MFFFNFIESTGDRVIKYSLFTYDFIIFLFKCLGNIFLPSNYCKASRIFLVKQIYLSAIGNLFSFIFLALFLGSISIVMAISFAINFSLIEQIGDLLVLLVINEFSPFFTTLFFMFVYSLPIKEKINTSNKQNNKIEKRALNFKFYIPKLLMGLFILPLMALLFSTIMILSGYIVSSLYLDIDYITYKNLIVNSINFENILILLVKGSIFGFIAVLIPLYSEHLKKSNFDISKLVIKNLIIILNMLILVELVFILIIY